MGGGGRAGRGQKVMTSLKCPLIKGNALYIWILKKKIDEYRSERTY